MTTLLNTLFVTAEAARVHKDHETLVVSIDHQVRARVPLLHVAGVVVFSPAFITPEAMHALAEQGAGVSYLSATGQFLARVEGLPGGNVLVRRAQFRSADSPAASLELARSMVAGKVFNSRVVIQRAARERDGVGERAERLSEVVGELALRLREVERAETVDALRGVEGLAARQYWEVFDQLIKRQRQDEMTDGGDGFIFRGRTRRPPKDRVNALLSFGYAMLMHDCVTACAACGLDPAVGFLHEDRPGRLSLALDLMEELRAPVVDRFTLALINREQLRPHDLRQDPTGGWSLTKEGRKTWFVAWQEAKREVLTHPYLDQEVPWQRVASLQALLLARQLRGDVDKYPPFLLK